MFDKLFGGNNEQEQEPEGQEPEQGGWTFDTVGCIAAELGSFGMALDMLWSCVQHDDFWGTKGTPFFVPLCVEFPGGAIIELLKRYGIEPYSYGVAGRQQFFYVDREDANRTQAVLNAYGVPTVEPGEQIQWKE